MLFDRQKIKSQIESSSFILRKFSNKVHEIWNNYSYILFRF